MKHPGASLVGLKRQGSWTKREMLRAITPHRPRNPDALPNPVCQKLLAVKRIVVSSFAKTARDRAGCPVEEDGPGITRRGLTAHYASVA